VHEPKKSRPRAAKRLAACALAATAVATGATAGIAPAATAAENHAHPWEKPSPFRVDGRAPVSESPITEFQVDKRDFHVLITPVEPGHLTLTEQDGTVLCDLDAPTPGVRWFDCGLTDFSAGRHVLTASVDESDQVRESDPFVIESFLDGGDAGTPGGGDEGDGAGPGDGGTPDPEPVVAVPAPGPVDPGFTAGPGATAPGPVELVSAEPNGNFFETRVTVRATPGDELSVRQEDGHTVLNERVPADGLVSFDTALHTGEHRRFLAESRRSGKVQSSSFEVTGNANEGVEQLEAFQLVDTRLAGSATELEFRGTPGANYQISGDHGTIANGVVPADGVVVVQLELRHGETTQVSALAFSTSGSKWASFPVVGLAPAPEPEPEPEPQPEPVVAEPNPGTPVDPAFTVEPGAGEGAETTLVATVERASTFFGGSATIGLRDDAAIGDGYGIRVWVDGNFSTYGSLRADGTGRVQLRNMGGAGDHQVVIDRGDAPILTFTVHI